MIRVRPLSEWSSGRFWQPCQDTTQRESIALAVWEQRGHWWTEPGDTRYSRYITVGYNTTIRRNEVKHCFLKLWNHRWYPTVPFSRVHCVESRYNNTLLYTLQYVTILCTTRPLQCGTWANFELSKYTSHIVLLQGETWTHFEHGLCCILLWLLMTPCWTYSLLWCRNTSIMAH